MKTLRLLALGALLVTGMPFAAQAADSPNALPDMVSFGLGAFDVDKNTPQLKTMDFRFEYRSGLSLVPLVYKGASSWDSFFQLHPFGGVEFTPRGQLYAEGGFVFDFLIGKHVVISPNFAFGFYNQGNGKDLGSVYEFRSTFEAGWRFDNNIRITGYFGHTSNAGIGDVNPGAEEAGAYVHVPVGILFGH
jgi:lipid A 3-O-deacylase